VTKPSGGQIALIVDDDLGFVWWLGERFHEAGYRPVPALTVRQAISIVKELNIKIPVVVVNPGLPGVRKLIRSLSQVDQPAVKVILIGDTTSPPSTLIRAHGTLERPSAWESVSRFEWLRKLRMILKQVEETAVSPKTSSYPPR
jgi:hypothetical protein